MATDYRTIDDYITGFPSEKQERLHLIRETITKNAPGATESIAYGMPAYKTDGKPLVYSADSKNISDSMPLQPVMINLKKNCRHINMEKVRFSFRIVNPYLLTLLLK